MQANSIMVQRTKRTVRDGLHGIHHLEFLIVNIREMFADGGDEFIVDELLSKD